jgi:8-oxo-dGTP pyrophosphatase MutT (NUDIX family)
VRKAVLLVRNKGQKWWCAPGGGWDHGTETLLECAKREVHEEAGVEVNILRHLYCQTLYIQNSDSNWLEHFWLAGPAGSTEVPQDHIDHFGVVDEARWFTKEQVQDITVFPKRVKDTFWDLAEQAVKEEDRYIGHTVL